MMPAVSSTIRSSFLSAFVLAGLAAGCSAAPSDDDEDHTIATQEISSCGERCATFMSGVGNDVEVQATGEDTSEPGSTQVFINYRDWRRYFRADEIGRVTAYVKLHTHRDGTASSQTHWLTLQNFEHGTLFHGSFRTDLGPSDTIDVIELAFTDVHRQTWDSNQSRNYVVRFADR